MRIAVSGDKGSFSEEAGFLYSNRQGVAPEMVYAIDMEGVLIALDKRDAEVGIFPVANSHGGLVQTAFSAMGRHLFEFIEELWMEVHQCLIVKPGIKKSEIKAIATHPQAITQCERYIKKELPRVKLIDWEDTAKAAKDLAGGILDKYTAVIAPARSAQLYNLEILQRGIQDVHPNFTTFIIVKRLK